MTIKYLWSAALALTLLGCGNLDRSRNTADARVQGRTLAQQVCANCHGLTGNPISPNFPRLAGQQPQYLMAQLQDFRSHQRSDPAGFEYMWGLSHHLSDKQIQQLADYYAAQAVIPTSGLSPTDSARGDQIFHQGVPDGGVPACQTCHGAQGQGGGPIPRLAGQYANYIVKQLQVFQRTNERPRGVAMKAVAHGLDPQDMVSVANYLQGLAWSTASK